LTATTRATVVFIFHFTVMLYTMFFFLTDGRAMVAKVMGYLPLDDADKERMLGKFVSVTRATLKGTVLIGAAQGVLSGLAFWVVGIEGSIFWGTVMVVLSIIPGVGGALVWVPAVIILIAMGEVWQGVGLAAFCALVVGSIDNLLRPALVGRDTQMHQLMIFFSTIGGLLAFGAMGFILGPILAALFLTVWEMFGAAFRGEIGGPAPTPDIPPQETISEVISTK
jgi:predicted PurR-regulated permease PerM